MQLVLHVLVFLFVGFQFSQAFGNTLFCRDVLSAKPSSQPFFRGPTPRVLAQTGFIKVAAGRELYIRYVAPKPGKPTIVLINGLTHNLHNWDKFADKFEQNGYGVLRYDPFGQGETLSKYGMPSDPVPYLDQVRDLKVLLDKLNITDPVNLVGLSYGGALSVAFAEKYPNRVDKIIPQSMYLGPLKSQDEWIRMQIDIYIVQADWVKVMFPWVGDSYSPRDPKIYDALYDYFLRQIVYYVYPTVEPEILSQLYKPEATFRLVQGIRKLKPTNDIAPNLRGKLHMMVALQDQYIDQKDFAAFWTALPAATKSSMLIIDGSKHTIISDVYDFASAWVKLIIDGDPRIDSGKLFQGSAKNTNAVNGTDTIDLTGVW